MINAIYKFEIRNYHKKIVEENNEANNNSYFYSKKEMTLINISFALSIGVNMLYWSIIFLKRDIMGDTETPAHVEYFLHGGNTVMILFECLLNRKSIHNRVDIKSKHVQGFAFLYITVKYFFYYGMGIQIYPMISKFSVPAYYLLAIIGYFLYYFSSLIFRFLFLKYI